MAQTAPMSAESRDHLSDLERQRLRLEDQLEQLRKSLRHWQTWDAEYEGLKEEIQVLREKDSNEPSTDQILAAGRGFDGELVNEKEIRELLGPNQQRTAGQVIDVISRRQDYVQQNVATVQKQVETTEDRLNKVLIISSPSLQDEEGGPLMDIREELDEEGNVLTSSVHKAGESAPRIVEALRKAGITDLQGDQKEQTGDEEVDAAKDTDKGKSRATAWEPAPPPSDKIHIDLSKLAETDASSKPFGDGSTQPSPAAEEPRRKKSVTFTPDTKPPAEEKPATPKPAAAPEAVEAKDPLSSYANFKPGSRIVELDDDDRVVNSERAGVVNPVIPDDESAEEAALRREMLEYSLNEVGNVVAELDLYDGTDDDDDEEWEDDDDDDDEDEEMEEDEWGRSRPSVSADYVTKMRKLEEKLKARMMENVGPVQLADADVNEVLQQAQGFHRLRVQTDEQIPPALLPRAAAAASSQAQRQDSPQQSATTTATMLSPTAEKKVKFAEDLDVAPPSTAAAASSPPASRPPAQPAVTPVSDAVIERNASSRAPTAPPPSRQEQELISTKKRPSRFKSARAATTTTTTTTTSHAPPPNSDPTPPTHATIASTILERPPSTPSATTSYNNKNTNDDDDDDDASLSPATLSSELMAQYHRARNTLISKQPGGFMAREGEATGGVVGPDGAGADAGDLVEDMGDGAVRRVSRFKAARVRGVGQ